MPPRVIKRSGRKVAKRDACSSRGAIKTSTEERKLKWLRFDVDSHKTVIEGSAAINETVSADSPPGGSVPTKIIFFDVDCHFSMVADSSGCDFSSDGAVTVWSSIDFFAAPYKGSSKGKFK